MSTWNLNDLYTSYESNEFTQDMDSLRSTIEELKKQAASLPEKIQADKTHSLLDLLCQFQLLSRRIGTYISLNSSANTTDTVTVAWRNQYFNLVSGASKPLTAINKALASIDLEECTKNDEWINEHRFYLQEIKDKSKYLLSDDVEEAIAKMELNASDAWSELQSYLTSTVEIPFNGKVETLSSIRNMAYSEDPEVRKAAYEAELAGYEKIKDAVAFSLNSIKGEANTIAKMRGYESVLDMTLINSRLKRETLDAMLSAMKKYLPEFHRYLRHKGKLLGHDNGLPFYDLFASLKCDSSRSFTIEEAREYLVKNFDTFSTEVSDIVNRAYDEQWIDFYPRKGKVGGAFCSNLPYLK